MSKRQMPDLSSLLTDVAVPMPDIQDPKQVTPRAIVHDAPVAAPEAKAAPKSLPTKIAVVEEETATANLENLNFKVPKSFRKRFRDCAYRADLKHNELLFAALGAWEAAQKSEN